jgi:hypothetical protein
MAILGRILGAVLLAGTVSASAVAAKNDCPPIRSDVAYPWIITDIMDGDQYADIFIDIDRKGKPIQCRMGKNNISGDDKFFVCKAFTEQWSTAAPTQVGPNGLATVERHYLTYGDKHEKAEREAKKAYFRQHPDQQPKCYPENDY